MMEIWSERFLRKEKTHSQVLIYQHYWVVTDVAQTELPTQNVSICERGNETHQSPIFSSITQPAFHQLFLKETEKIPDGTFT